jgi:uncharacterized protein
MDQDRGMIPEEIHNQVGERLAYSFVPGSPVQNELVVIGHGLTSDKDRPWSEALSTELQQQGIPSLRVAFSGNGESEGDFIDSNITKEVDDLRSVLDALPGQRIAYVGHSMGGAVGLLAAKADPRLLALVSLAAVTHTKEFVERMFGHLLPGEPMLDKPHCPFGATLRDDLVHIESICSLAPNILVPWLIVHGSADEVVPEQHSIDLHQAATPATELVLMEDIDHSFSGPGLKKLTEIVVPWLTRALR